MATIRIPTPLRPYVGGQDTIELRGETVGDALNDLVQQHPDIEQHLFNDGELRTFVNVYLGEDDIRYLQGKETPLKESDRLLLVPSIAGGIERTVDHAALRVNQTFIISLLLLAFIVNVPLLVGFVALVMIVGTIWPQIGLFKRIYRHILKPTSLVNPDVISDNPEPHRFAQGLGGAFTLASLSALLVGATLVGWALAWLVIVLAALNLFLGFCAGCFVYYQLNRLGIPGFSVAPVSAE